MNIKQTLFLITVLGFVANITPANNQADKHIPTYLHYEEFPPTNNHCFVSARDVEKIKNKAEKILGEPLPFHAYHMDTLPNESHTCRLLLIYMKNSNPAQLEAARKEAILKYFK